MTLTLRKIAEFVPGETFGEVDVPLSSVCPLDEAIPNSITFVADRRNLEKLKNCQAAAIIAPKRLIDEHHTTPAELLGQSHSVKGLITVEEPLQAILTVAQKFLKPIEKPSPNVDPRAFVHRTAQLGPGVSVGPFAYVGADTVIGARTTIHPHAVVREQCELGEQVEIHPHVVLYPRTKLGQRVIIHSGSVIGADGFGYVKKQGKQIAVPQLGRVELGDDVEIGANTTVDRATIGVTRIGEGTKIDNLVQIAHNCQIGRHNIVVGQTGLAGSVVTGDHVVLAGQTGIADHVQIGERAVIGARSGLFQNVPAGEVYLGTPARPERDAKKHFLYIERLGEMRRQLTRVLQHLQLPAENTDDKRQAS